MLLWRGFGFRWRFTSHRLPLLSSWVEDAPPRHHCGLRIGAFPSDTAEVTAHTLLLDSPHVRLVHRGRTDLRVAAHLGWPADAHARLPLAPLMASDPGQANDAPPLPPGHTLVPVLDGFSVRALGSDAGWHFGALGLEVAIDDGELVVTARIRPAESPHPWIFGLGDWTWEDDAIHDVTVGWALLATPRALVREFVSDGRASSTNHFVQTTWPSSAEHAPEVPLSTAPPSTSPPPPPESGVHSAGGSGPQRGRSMGNDASAAAGTTPRPSAPTAPISGPVEAVLLQGFDFAVDAPPTLRRRSGYLRNLNGRYIRTLSAGIVRRGDEDTPNVAIGNQVHGLIRLGSVLALFGVLAGAVAGLFVPTTFIAALALIVFLAGATVAWPSLWLTAPAVPFQVATRLACVVLQVPSEALTIRHRHVPQPTSEHVSVGSAEGTR